MEKKNDQQKVSLDNGCVKVLNSKKATKPNACMLLSCTGNDACATCKNVCFWG